MSASRTATVALFDPLDTAEVLIVTAEPHLFDLVSAQLDTGATAQARSFDEAEEALRIPERWAALLVDVLLEGDFEVGLAYAQRTAARLPDLPQMPFRMPLDPKRHNAWAGSFTRICIGEPPPAYTKGFMQQALSVELYPDRRMNRAWAFLIDVHTSEFGLTRLEAGALKLGLWGYSRQGAAAALGLTVGELESVVVELRRHEEHEIRNLAGRLFAEPN